MPTINQQLSEEVINDAVEILNKATQVNASYVGYGGIITKENWAFNIILRAETRTEIFKNLLECQNTVARAYAICGLFILSKNDFNSAKAKYLQDSFEVTVYIGCRGERLSNKDFLTSLELGYLPKAMVLEKVGQEYKKYN